MNLTLQTWQTLTPQEKEEVGQRIAHHYQISYSGIITPHYKNCSFSLSSFLYKDKEFLLIPGGEVQLGISPSQYKSLLEEEKQSFESEDIGIPFPELLQSNFFSKERTVNIPPLLVEKMPNYHEFEEEVSLELIEEQKILSDSHVPFRLPTSDEWEYLCSGTGRTLFRWGNGAPNSNSYHDTITTIHKEPNQFGLLFSDDTYRVEYCQDERAKGGDGGMMVCGGYQSTITWISFSSWWVNEEEDWYLDSAYLRRVLDLSDFIL